MTPAETPTECADLSFAYSDDKEIVALYLTIDGKTTLFVERGNEGRRIEALDARIRELEGVVTDTRAFFTIIRLNGIRRDLFLKACTLDERAEAALARSEGKP